MFRIIGKTHPGAVRDHNEDTFLCDETKGLAVVADGMGGYAAGEVASEITVKTMAELNPAADKLVASLVECHNRIVAHANANPESKGMGAAVVAAKLGARELSVCWAGDSRAYLFSREGKLKAVSRDHSYVQWLLSQGQLSEAQARAHPDRNLVTQCLGLQPPQPELNTVKWRSGDVLLLCSDGLSDELSDPEIAELLRNTGDLEEAAEQLLEAALQAGGKDNITVVLAANMSLTEVKQAPVQRRKNSGQTLQPWLPVLIGVLAAVALVALGLFSFW